MKNEFSDEDKKWEVLNSEYLIRRPWLTARKDKVRLPSGVVMDEYYVLEYPEWVNVIAITTEGKFLMERQYRHGLQWIGYEICAGVCEKGETPLEAAKRELLEETGFGGGEWTPHMTISSNTSTVTNLTHCLWQPVWSVCLTRIRKRQRIFPFICFLGRKSASYW